jgi:hypothetical protein
MKGLFAILLLLLGCVSEHRYCDPDTLFCWICDGVGCRPDPTGRPTTPCFDNQQCSAGSRCVNSECRVPCQTFSDCQRVDVGFGSCQSGYCSTEE